MESMLSLKAITSDVQYLKVYGYNGAWAHGRRKPPQLVVGEIGESNWVQLID